MAIELIKNAKITWDAADISGTANEVSVQRSRPVVSSESFGDDALAKDPGSRDEEISLTIWYTEGGAEALAELEDAFEAGTKHAIVVEPKGAGIGNKTYTATVFVSEIPITLTKGEKARFTVTLPVDGQIAIGAQVA